MSIPKHETFHDIERNTALGSGFCYRCGKPFQAGAPIVYADFHDETLKRERTVAFHRACWEPDIADVFDLPEVSA